jgi:hypothetical protein
MTPMRPRPPRAWDPVRVTQSRPTRTLAARRALLPQPQHRDGGVERGPVREFHKNWIEQCEAARDIRAGFGLRKVLGYLIGEKLLNFLRAAKDDAAFVGEVPSFVAGIKEIFDREEVQTYLDTVQRVGALGHVATDDVYEEMRVAGAIDEDPVWWAEDILLNERAKELLLG